MNLYKLSQVNNYSTWPVYSVAVVAAPNEDEARMMHPDPDMVNWKGIDPVSSDGSHSWVDACDVLVEYLGVAKQELFKGFIAIGIA